MSHRNSVNVALLLVLVCLTFDTGCERNRGYLVGTPRSTVYAIMGKPSNDDDEVIAFWSADGRTKGKHWRDICHGDGYIAVFDSGHRTLLPKVGFSATDIHPSMTDPEILAQVVERPIE